QVVNRRLTCWRQDAVNLVESTDRIAEVLERRRADHEIERRVGKGHLRRVTVAEIDCAPSPPAILPGNPDEGPTDIEARHAVTPRLCNLNRAESGPRRDLQHSTAWRHAVCHH